MHSLLSKCCKLYCLHSKSICFLFKSTQAFQSFQKHSSLCSHIIINLIKVSKNKCAFLNLNLKFKFFFNFSERTKNKQKERLRHSSIKKKRYIWLVFSLLMCNCRYKQSRSIINLITVNVHTKRRAKV